MKTEKTVSQAVEARRSVRIYDKKKAIDDQKVKQCIEQAVLAPNSSNMQLWEFHHLSSEAILKKMQPLCFDQNSAKTAKQLVVVVANKSLWKKRAKANIDFLNVAFDKPNLDKKWLKRKKMALSY